MQKFHKGDHVKVACDYSTGFMISDGESKPILSEWAGKEAIVIASYSDQFGVKDSGGDYTLHIKGQGEVSWFCEKSLILIEYGRIYLLEAWEAEKETERKEKADIDWIFTNGDDVITNPHGASIETLAECFGMTNLWGKHGEGFIYYQNAMATLGMAAPFLKSGDKEGWLELCEKMRGER